MKHSFGNLFVSIFIVAALAFGVLGVTPARAATFTPGSIVIYRVGAGSGSLVNTGNPVFLDEYTTSGSLIQSIALPTIQDGGQYPLIASGTASSEGLLTRSADGRYLVLAGYGTTTGGGSSLSGTTGASVPRVVGRVDADGNVDTSTALSDFASGSNPRSATSFDGSTFWVAGGLGGVRYVTALGNTTSNDLSSTAGSGGFANVRQVGIFDGQLYASSGANGSGGANTFKGVETVGSGLPTSGAQTITRLPGLTDTNSPSNNSFFLADLDSGVAGVDTLYVADDSVDVLTKFSLVSGTWMSNGTIGSAGDDYRGLTGIVSGTIVTLFSTRKGGGGATGGGELVTLVDGSGYNGAFSGTPTVLATAAANTAFRGIALAPVNPATPTPTVTETPTITETSTPTGTPTAAAILTETAPPTITETPTETSTPTISETPSETLTPTMTETSTETNILTETSTSTAPETTTPTSTITVTGTSIPTATETVTPTPTITVTETSIPAATETVTPTPTTTVTETSTPIVTETVAPTETVTPTPTITVTETSISTATETVTATVTVTETLAITPTQTAALTATVTPTLTTTPTGTNTVTSTVTATSTATATSPVTATSTPTRTPTRTVVTITLNSLGAQDGSVLESTETSNVGGTLNSSANYIMLGDSASKKQYRSVLSFTTGGLPDNAVITGIKLMLKQMSIAGGGNPVTLFQGLMVDVKKGIFDTASLQISDFQATASKTYGPFLPVSASGWYTVDLSVGQAYINKLGTNSGLTQIRLRFKLDDNNNAIMNTLNLYSGNATAAADRPKLVITYYVP